MFHNQGNKDEVFDAFKKNKDNAILVSPIAFEGVDFPYDQARWQCICKDPFPNIGDPQIRAREDVDFDWTFRQRCLVLSQMYGRTNRAADDWSVTYLLDSRLESLLGPSSLVTDYFYEALQGSHYNDKLVLNENAYEKLTNPFKINRRSDGCPQSLRCSSTLLRANAGKDKKIMKRVVIKSFLSILTAIVNFLE
jgi:hypothetical protein